MSQIIIILKASNKTGSLIIIDEELVSGADFRRYGKDLYSAALKVMWSFQLKTMSNFAAPCKI